jgi:hypothetical protein
MRNIWSPAGKEFLMRSPTHEIIKHTHRRSTPRVCGYTARRERTPRQPHEEALAEQRSSAALSTIGL